MAALFAVELAEAAEEAAEEPAVPEAELVPDAFAMVEEAEAEVEDALEAAEAELAAASTAVAFNVPHFSLFVQICWPWASLGWALMHCMKVASQM